VFNEIFLWIYPNCVRTDKRRNVVVREMEAFREMVAAF
jgi:hypothetical protein